MKTENLTPEKSLELITQVINEAKTKFEENGFIYVFWGALVSIASISQFVLLKNEYYNINYYPYFLMPIGAIYTWYYFSKKKKSKKNQISRIVSIAWVILSLNMMILGFFFGPMLKENLIPVILILLSVGTMISGVTIKSKLILFSGIIINISALICFNLEWIYQPLAMGILSVITFLIPGVILMIQNNK
ncbi:MAG: hypothetical protein KAG95_07110 [Bacteroidales bacterium]|nr:hypothetical protein [Bacteroidales bacterium]